MRAGTNSERFPALAADVVRQNPDFIVTWGTPAALAAKNATTTIPIVMGAIGDAIRTGVVTSLARPGGNITGLSSLAVELEAKRLELLKSLAPQISRVAVLWNADNPSLKVSSQTTIAAAQKLEVKLSFVSYDRGTDLRRQSWVASVASVPSPPRHGRAVANRSGPDLQPFRPQRSERLAMRVSPRALLVVVRPRRGWPYTGPLEGHFLLNLRRRSLADRDSLSVSLRGLCAARSSGQQARGGRAVPASLAFHPPRVLS